MKLTSENAIIRTAQVEVKTLTVSGRQVTLAVFRQLQKEPLIDLEEIRLLGIPWGKVNYFFGECEPDHLHIVWQTGTELRRACVWRDTFLKAQKYQEYERRLRNLLKLRHSQLWASGEATIATAQWIQCGKGNEWIYDSEFPRVIKEGHNYGDWRLKEEPRRTEELAERGFKLKEAYGANASMPEEEIEQRVNQYYEARLDWQQRWEELYDGLASLDQLFIAV